MENTKSSKAYKSTKRRIDQRSSAQVIMIGMNGYWGGAEEIREVIRGALRRQDKDRLGKDGRQVRFL